MKEISKVTICGGGNGAQALVPIAANNLGCPVDVYAPFGDEAARLGGEIETSGAVRSRAQARKASADPSYVIPGSDLIVLVLPAFAHESTLRQIIPFLDRDALVGAIPARGGFDYCAASILAAHGREDISLFGLQTLPWACRIKEYGRQVHILGVKKTVDAACRPAGKNQETADLLGQMLAMPIGLAANGLALTLANTGQLIHPGIMYGLFSRWDGAPFEEAPLFYHGLSEYGASVLEGLSDEVQEIRAKLEGTLDLSAVRPLKSWLLHSYGDLVGDPATLRSAFLTNSAYAGLRAPMKETAPGKLLPDLGARYLSEDVPYGLVASRAIAQLAGVRTPVMDTVITWAGAQLGKDYLERDAGDARIPQRYGLKDIDQLIQFSSEE